MDQIYFTADLHFGHPNILKHSPKRPYSDTVDIVAHDAWLLDLWCSTVDKRDSRLFRNSRSLVGRKNCTETVLGSGFHRR